MKRTIVDHEVLAAAGVVSSILNKLHLELAKRSLVVNTTVLLTGKEGSWGTSSTTYSKSLTDDLVR